MVTPAARRAWAVWVQEAFRVSVRRAGRATGVHRSLLAHRFRQPPQEALRARLRELARARVSYGCLRLHTLLVREGWRVNRKRVHQLYREEGLQLRMRRPKRRRSAVARGPRVVPTAANQVWAMDFMQDTLAEGRALRVLTLIDSFTRECLALLWRRASPATMWPGWSGRSGLAAASRRASRSTTGPSSPRRRWMPGPTGTTSSSTSAGRASPWTTA